MRLHVDHRTRYAFSAPQTRIVQLLRLTPADTDQQTVTDWQLHVDCDARLRPGRDGFGNPVTMLYAEGPISSLEIAVAGDVLTVEAAGLVSGGAEPLPVALYRRATPLTGADAALIDFARASAAGTTTLDRLHALNRAIAARWRFDPGRPVAGRSAAEAFAADAATARDLAHILIASARAIGDPARYISGYSLAIAQGGTQPAPHGWAEIWVDGLGWIGFDPSLGLCATEHYVRVAIGLDAASAAPVAGSRLGDGGESLAVDIHVDAVGNGND